MQHQLGEIVPRLESLFDDEPFDPRSGSHAFRLAGNDYVVSVIAPPLLNHVFAESPQATLRFEAWHGAVYADVERGAVDIVFTGGAAPAPLRSEQLFEDRFVCVMSAEHPRASGHRLTLDEYLECGHLVVDVVDGGQGAVERRLDAIGRPRRASVSLPYHGSAAAAVRGTMLIATLPWRVVGDLNEDQSLVVRDVPAEIAPMAFSMGWHPRLDDIPAQRWMRDMIRATASLH